MPLAVSGGTKAVATATPTTATDRLREIMAYAPAVPPARATITSMVFGAVRAMISWLCDCSG